MRVPSLSRYTQLRIAKALDKDVIPLFKNLKVTGEFLSDDTKVEGLEEEFTQRWHPDEDEVVQDPPFVEWDENWFLERLRVLRNSDTG